MTTLYGIHYSPWSLRAKWALTHHEIPFDYSEYTPMLSEPGMRLKLRAPTGKVTVPILITDGAVLRDSYAIAKWADEHGSGAPLFAAGEDVNRAWTSTAEEIADAGRVMSTLSTNKDPAAMRDNVPGFIPRAFRGVASPLVRTGTAFLAYKYGFGAGDAESAMERLAGALDKVATELEHSDYLTGDFGWPDIAVVSSLELVSPAEGWVRLGKAARRARTRDEIVAEYPAVIAWRDRILRDHGPRGYA